MCLGFFCVCVHGFDHKDYFDVTWYFSDCKFCLVGTKGNSFSIYISIFVAFHESMRLVGRFDPFGGRLQFDNLDMLGFNYFFLALKISDLLLCICKSI